MDPENDAYFSALLGSAWQPPPLPNPALWYAQALDDYGGQFGAVARPEGAALGASAPPPGNSGPSPAPATIAPLAPAAGASDGGFTDNAGQYHPGTLAQGYTDGRLVTDGPQIRTAVLPAGADPASLGIYETPGGYRFARMRVNGRDTEYDLGVLLHPGDAAAQAQAQPGPAQRNPVQQAGALSSDPRALLADVVANTPSEIIWRPRAGSSGGDPSSAEQVASSPDRPHALFPTAPAFNPDIHTLLGAAAFAPGPLGSLPALIDAGIYLHEGKYGLAAIDLLAAGLGAFDGDAGGTKAALAGIGEAGRVVERALARPNEWDWALGGVRGLGVESNAIVQNRRHDDDGPHAGVYWGDDQAGGRYVGQSNDTTRRDKQNIASGRFAPGAKVEFIRVPGGREARELAEHRKIQDITGGQKAKNSPLVSNKRDPIGPRRRKRLGEPEPRD